MTVATAHLSESLQTLIDSRLDTIDRMLLGRLSRQDRLAIVREVESQIQELLHERDADDITREDVLAVLGKLDPPEAYIPDELDAPQVKRSGVIHTRELKHAAAAADDDLRIARASGILGIAAVALFLSLPLSYVIAMAAGSEGVLFALGGATLLLMSISGIVGLALGIRARLNGAWAIAGIVTSLAALLLALDVTAWAGALLR